MIRNLSFVLLFAGTAALLLSFGGCATHPSYGRVSVADERTRIDVSFSSRDRNTIRDWYRRHLPPGLAKQGKIPPGHRKRLARQGHLPPDVEGRRLPRELRSRLAPVPEGYVRLRIGTDIVLMNTRTRLIVDMVEDIGR